MYNIMSTNPAKYKHTTHFLDPACYHIKQTIKLWNARSHSCGTSEARVFLVLVPILFVSQLQLASLQNRLQKSNETLFCPWFLDFVYFNFIFNVFLLLLLKKKYMYLFLCSSFYVYAGIVWIMDFFCDSRKMDLNYLFSQFHLNISEIRSGDYLLVPGVNCIQIRKGLKVFCFCKSSALFKS